MLNQSKSLFLALVALSLPVAAILPRAFAGDVVATAPLTKKAVPTELFEIEKVVDGDTIHIMRNGKIEKLRLLSVDTEEKMASGTSASGTKPPTVFGEECAQWAQGFFAGLAKDGAKPKIGIAFPNGKEQYDFYGRLLCTVILPDGTDYNLMIVEMGKSPYFSKYGWSETDHEAFVAAQKSARAAQRGIWDPKTNQPTTPGVPSAKRPYEKLVPWWDARAEAVQAFRDAKKKDATKVCDTDDPVALAEAAKRDEVVQCFGEMAKVTEDANGGMTVHFRASKKDHAFVVFVPKEKKEAFKALDLAAAAEEFHQNYLWFETKVTADPKGYFKAESSDPAKWKRAGPEPVIPK
jgi:endonuclease YncB( thermonuclease family)